MTTPTALTAQEIDDLGVEFLTLKVLRFFDADDSKRWFYREHELVGQIVTPCIDGTPMNPSEMFAFVRAHFGDDVAVIW